MSQEKLIKGAVAKDLLEPFTKAVLLNLGEQFTMLLQLRPEFIGVLFDCFARKEMALVYLVVQSSTRAIYFPEKDTYA